MTTSRNSPGGVGVGVRPLLDGLTPTPNRLSTCNTYIIPLLVRG